ncbi:putative glucuronoxylan glucuronosyltransferase IRX7-like [Hibiscus syriacus]|uniref:Glucuronoxylan glucuronosyltransferase IRX7-like n=1 Tax=Hibiscus syriacus TaxID=106335 RepID=A0A6A2X7P6_HIBSY|nr:putative glucuronoxylan glucuronosyltransferase IRX7-like [Hibiscus syriacus]
MDKNLMDKVTAFGELLKTEGAEVGRKMSAEMSSMSFKVKELFQGPNPAHKLVDDATSEALDEPDWALNLDICDMINHEKISSVELIRGIKRRMMLKNPRVQCLSLVLLETCVKNCENAFSEVAAERVLDEMVKLIDDPQTVVNNKNKALMLIESWGESTGELRYLPVYEETYKSLKSRGIRFPGRGNESLAPIFTPPRSVSAAEVDASLANQFQQDMQLQHDAPLQTFTSEQTKEAFDVARNRIELLSTVLSSSPQQDALEDDLTTTLVWQCRQTLSKYEELKKPSSVHHEAEPAMIPVAVEPDDSPRHTGEDALVRKPAAARHGTHGGSNDDMMDDLDEMIFGKKGGGSSEVGQDSKKQQGPKDDLITF